MGGRDATAASPLCPEVTPEMGTKTTLADRQGMRLPAVVEVIKYLST